MHEDLFRFLFPKLLLKFAQKNACKEINEDTYACWLLEFFGLNNLDDEQVIHLYNSLFTDSWLEANYDRFSGSSQFIKATATTRSYMCRYDALYQIGQKLLEHPTDILNPDIVDFGIYQEKELIPHVVAQANLLKQRQPARPASRIHA